MHRAARLQETAVLLSFVHYALMCNEIVLHGGVPNNSFACRDAQSSSNSPTLQPNQLNSITATDLMNRAKIKIATSTRKFLWNTQQLLLPYPALQGVGVVSYLPLQAGTWVWVLN